MINEKYEHLRRIELHNTSATKIFRLIAWVIDWNLIGLMTLFAIAFSMGFIGEFNNSLPAPFALFLILLILSYPICFILRDLIFGGRSIGKRIMGLTLLDISTGKAPKKISLILRNIFLQIVEVECIILLITGRTLGDRAAHTVVIRKKDMEPRKEESSAKQNIKKINQYAASRTECAKSNKKRRALWIGIVIAAAVLFMGGIFLYLRTVMNQTKESEEYKLAYSYVITSKSFDELDIEESRLKFSSYSLRSYKDEDNETRYDAEIIFKAGFWKKLSVTLHNNGNGWYVCEECTDFE